MSAQRDQTFQCLSLRESTKQKHSCDKVQALRIANLRKFQRKPPQNISKSLLNLNLIELCQIGIGPIDILIDLKEDRME